MKKHSQEEEQDIRGSSHEGDLGSSLRRPRAFATSITTGAVRSRLVQPILVQRLYEEIRARTTRHKHQLPRQHPLGVGEWERNGGCFQKYRLQFATIPTKSVTASQQQLVATRPRICNCTTRQRIASSPLQPRAQVLDVFSSFEPGTGRNERE